jgi:hypothetical protein
MAGRYLLNRGEPGEARPLLERALAIDEQAYGPNHPTVVVYRNNLRRLRDEPSGDDADGSQG